MGESSDAGISVREQPLEAMAQLYRDRADAENGFDELKNQWGWGGFTNADLSISSGPSAFHFLYQSPDTTI